ncbi:MAG: protein phosphatase 2C domain-containing protein [Leptothrix sp. (in: b-proteobacteria)]
MICAKCSEPVAPDFAFCENCGSALRPHGAPTAPAANEVDEVSDVQALEVQALDDIAAFASHCGRQRADNQDAAGLLHLPGAQVVLAVADGVSTACHSRRAADLAVQQALDTIANGLQTHQADQAGPAALLKLAVTRAHAAICKLPHDDPQLAEPQTTLAVALVQDGVVWYAWVGDSRVYLLQSEGSRQLSVDDSWLNDCLRQGVPFDEATAAANAHCITQCLGMRDAEPTIHVATAAMSPGSCLLLCSDGLWNYFAQAADLWACVDSSVSDGTPLQCCADLIDRANRAGGADNVTVALYRHRQAQRMNFVLTRGQEPFFPDMRHVNMGG